MRKGTNEKRETGVTEVHWDVTHYCDNNMRSQTGLAFHTIRMAANLAWYRLCSQGIRVHFLEEARVLFGTTWVHPASYTVNTRGYFLMAKAAEP
jgi:hypothetical protein